ncbi:MAG: hypothetical protein HDR48_03850 [Bacteroides sp.]|nr:hypothetical protein [Bacteroides sp.]
MFSLPALIIKIDKIFTELFDRIGKMFKELYIVFKEFGKDVIKDVREGMEYTKTH